MQIKNLSDYHKAKKDYLALYELANKEPLDIPTKMEFTELENQIIDWESIANIDDIIIWPETYANYMKIVDDYVDGDDDNLSVEMIQAIEQYENLHYPLPMQNPQQMMEVGVNVVFAMPGIPLGEQHDRFLESVQNAITDLANDRDWLVGGGFNRLTVDGNPE